jgi:hypothetical protein
MPAIKHDREYAATETVMRRCTRPCLFCGGAAAVVVPEGATEADVDAAFTEAGRSFANYMDDDPVGVACYRCARKQWQKEGFLLAGECVEPSGDVR